LKGKGKGRRPAQHTPLTPLMLNTLPDHLILSVLLAPGSALSAIELARLERVSKVFRARKAQLLLSDDAGGAHDAAQPEPAVDAAGTASASLVECAAERKLQRRVDAWRIARRPGETWKYALHALERLLCPLPTVAVGRSHTLVLRPAHSTSPAGHRQLIAFGSDQFFQLGLGLGLGSEGDRLGQAAVAANSQPVVAGGRSRRSHWWTPEEAARRSSPPFIAVVDAGSTGAGAAGQLVGVAAGAAHSVALTKSGELYSWGDAGCGQVGLPVWDGWGDGVVVPAPRLLRPCGGGAPRSQTLVVGGARGQVSEPPPPPPPPTEPPAVPGAARLPPPQESGGFPSETCVAMVAAAGHTSACVDSCGGLWSWGAGDLGQHGWVLCHSRVLAAMSWRYGCG
jgi:hypothetical protein